MDDWHGNQIANTHLTPEEQPDLRAADVVLNELLDHVDIVLPRLQRSQSLVDIGSAPFNNERLV